MKNVKNAIAHVLVFALCLSTFLTGASADAKAKKPKLSSKSITLTKGKTKTLKVYRTKKCKVTWKTSNKKIVSLSKKKRTSCKLKAVKKGTAKITCKVKKNKKTYKLTCKVKVKAKKTVVATSLKGAYKDIVPYMGSALNYGSSANPGELQKSSTMKFVKQHFNSFTLENEMKPDSILGSSVTAISVDKAKSMGYYIPAGYTESTVPQLDFSRIDKVLEVAKNNGLKMRAHTLVWHSQTPSWFFTKDYDGSKVVTAATMDARLEFYIHNVMSHIMDKEKALTGSAGNIVYAWDVVNEYLHRPSFAFFKTWTSVYGDMGASPSYVKKAFEIAYDMLKKYDAQDKVTLFYNDYNTYFGVEDTLNLVNFINKDEPAKICGGIGMQSHVDVKVPTVSQYGSALEKFLAAGYEIQITELDFTINFDTEGASASYAYRDENETNADQAKFVKNLMQTIITKQKNRNKTVNPKGITSITLWGLCDATSWRSQCAPLLFDTGIYDPKPSYYSFLEAAKVW